MHAGRLDRKVVLERATIVQSDSGQPIETWDELARLWADLRPLRGWEKAASPGHAAHEEVAFEMRWGNGWADLNPKDRIVCAGVTYDILAVHEIGRREGLKVVAKRKAD